LPPGISVTATANYIDNNGWQTSFADSEHEADIFAVAMFQESILSKDIPAALASEIQGKIARRSGPRQPYEIPAGSIQMISINGQQAMKATGRFEQPGGGKMAELLAWIISERTTAHFYAILPAENQSDFQTRFDQMVQSATVP
jgi:hypothetical protein